MEKLKTGRIKTHGSTSLGRFVCHQFSCGFIDVRRKKKEQKLRKYSSSLCNWVFSASKNTTTSTYVLKALNIP